MKFMKPKVVFGIMSALQPAATVGQLVDTLGGHPVVIHHDFRKLANFVIDRPNVTILSNPKETGWGTPGFVQGILQLLEHCLDNIDFDYFQLLSPTCLPLRPLEEYVAHLEKERAEIFADLIDICGSEESMVNYGFRAFVPGSSLRQKILRRARTWYFGTDATLVQTRSLAVLHRHQGHGNLVRALAGSIGLSVTRIAANGWLARRPHLDQWRPAIGSVWFCVSRLAGRRLLEMASEPELMAFYRQQSNVDESLFPTLFANSGLSISRSNHAVSPFNLTGHPRWVTTDEDLDALTATGRYFGRKFPADPSSPIRQRILQRILARAAEAPTAVESIPNTLTKNVLRARSHDVSTPRNIEMRDDRDAHRLVRGYTPINLDNHEAPKRDGSETFLMAAGAPTLSVPRNSQEPRIIFGIMSAVAKLATVEQLATSLYPYQVVVHHDFSQQPNFHLRVDNARFVTDPKRTGYGVWAFTEGIIRLIEYCLENIDFDYFQLLSPACMPIKPPSEFSAYIAGSTADANIDFIDPRIDRDAMMCFGPRIYSPSNSLRRRILQGTRRIYLGTNPLLKDVAGVQVACCPTDFKVNPLAVGAYAVMRLAQMGWFGNHPPEPRLAPKVGGVWFGARRKVCEYLVDIINHHSVYDHYRRLNDCGESSFHTIFAESGYRLGPSNTNVSEYEGWHPRLLQLMDLDRLRNLPQFFARKFPDDPDAPIRKEILELIKTEPSQTNVAHSPR